MTASAGQWWTETRAGGAELSCWRHETLEGSLGAAHEDPSSPAGRRRGALCTGASWQVPAPSLGLTSCPGGEQPLGLLGVGTWGAGSPQAGMVLEEGGNVWLPVGTPCCGSAGQGGAGAELSAGCGWGSVRLPPSSAAAGGGDPGASRAGAGPLVCPVAEVTGALLSPALAGGGREAPQPEPAAALGRQLGALCPPAMTGVAGQPSPMQTRGSRGNLLSRQHAAPSACSLVPAPLCLALPAATPGGAGGTGTAEPRG